MHRDFKAQRDFIINLNFLVMEKTTNKINFAILADYSKVGTKKESIYKLDILSGTEKERKAIRRKIRNTRDNIISAFNSANKAEKKVIANKWTEFAKGVYKDINIIFEANTTDDKAAQISEFVANVKKVLAEK